MFYVLFYFIFNIFYMWRL